MNMSKVHNTAGTKVKNLHSGTLRFGVMIFRAYELGKLFMGHHYLGVIIFGGQIFIFQSLSFLILWIDP